jgi:hypothetical protein
MIHDEEETLHDAIQEPLEGEKLQISGPQIRQEENKDAGQDPNSLGAPDNEENLVDDNGYQNDIQGILPPEIEEQGFHGVMHQSSAEPGRWPSAP